MSNGCFKHLCPVADSIFFYKYSIKAFRFQVHFVYLFCENRIFLTKGGGWVRRRFGTACHTVRSLAGSGDKQLKDTSYKEVAKDTNGVLISDIF